MIDLKGLQDMVKGLEKQNQSHVSFPGDGVIIKKDELLSAEQINKQMHLKMKTGNDIILKNTNFTQFQESWNK